MAHLWERDESDGGDAAAGAVWAPRLLRGSTFAPAGHATPANSGDGEAPVLRCVGGPTADAWVLIGAARVRVNGAPLSVGIRVLRDRDELYFGGGQLYFSTERLACVTPFPGSEQACHCPRCKQTIAAQSAAVQCPQCHVWHHQSDDLPCWTYSERCALCDQPTALNGSYRWAPGEL